MKNFYNNLILLDANEQFELHSFFFIPGLFVYFILIFLLVISIGCFYFFFSSTVNVNLLIENCYFFIKNTVKGNVVSSPINEYVPYFFIVFLFIFTSNLIGIFTFSYTVTSLLIIPFFFSFTNFVFTSILMIRKYSSMALAGFLPLGTSLTIAPLLIIIEFISYFIKLISLAVRLFANMFAGHILIKVLLSLIWVLLNTSVFIGWILAVFIFFLVAAILCLELFICGLQVFVFINLASIYLEQSTGILTH